MTAKPYGAPGGASTSFGGNPLAIATALATTAVIEQERLLENALRVGAYMRKQLETMQAKHPLIGDVRGLGLLLGVELVKDRKTKEPAREEGQQVYLESVRRGLKFLTTDELTRLSPPLNISQALAEEALDIYESALGAVEKRYGYV
jgi:4-aminobutyrate aminotransferase-like enzyme